MEKIQVILLPGQKIFLTSDLHVGHKNVLRFCNRPFLDIKDMSKDLIENWNRVVGENDIVFDLGDMFWFDGRHEIKKFIEKLNGHIYKLPGNHDMNVEHLFELCDPKKVTVCRGTVCAYIQGLNPEKPSKVYEVWMNHFPLATWPHFEHTIQVFGHIHSGPLANNAVDVPGKDLILTKRQYDVGVDNNNFEPINILDVYKKLGVSL